MVHVSHLRDKIAEATGGEKVIETVWGVGYKIEDNHKKFFTFEKSKRTDTLLTLTPKEISELVLEGIVTLRIVFPLYLGNFVMVSQLINEPGFISVEFSAREVWHIEREQIAF